MKRLRLDTLRTRAKSLWQCHGRETPLAGLFVIVQEAPSGPIHAIYQPSLCVVLQGTKVSRLGDSFYRYGTGKCLITSMEVPVQAEIVAASEAEPYIAVVLTIDPAIVAELMLEQVQDRAAAAKVSSALSVHALSENLIDPLERLLALATQPRDIPVLAPMVRREILWYLLNGPHGAALRQIGLADSRTARIGRSIAWLQENYTETISVPHLASLAGMSPATFHRHFKAATAMTPLQFCKSLRLHEARRRLLSEGDATRVGFAIGYESASQFNREYRRMFGAPPGRDRAEIRRSVASENRT